LQSPLQHSYVGSGNGNNANSICAGTYRADYFSNPDLSGSPSLTRYEHDINFDWGNAAPAAGLPSDNFSVRWTAQFYAPADGNYSFNIRVDDGARVYIDGIKVSDQWEQVSSYTISPYILRGSHSLVVEFHEHGGAAYMHFEQPGFVYANSSAQVLRVPHYKNVLVQSGGILTAHAWNGGTGGILAFKANGVVTVQAGGTIDVSGEGFRGGSGSANADPGVSGPGVQGEGEPGVGIGAGAANGVGGGGTFPYGADGGAGGAGGGNNGAGGNGGNGQGTGGRGGNAGGSDDLKTMLFGGAGGGGQGEKSGKGMGGTVAMAAA